MCWSVRDRPHLVESIPMHLSSPAFRNDEMIPQRFGLDFENVNPPLVIEGVPDGTVSLVVIIEDPDLPTTAPVAIWDHWVVFNIPPTITSIPEGWQPTGVRGVGTRGQLDYTGPRPPDREHRYFFRVYALDTMLDLVEGARKEEILEAASPHIIASAELMGRFAPA